MNENKELENLFNHYGRDIMNTILSESSVVEFAANSVLIRENQFIKVVPIVLNGLIKVYTGENDKELLIYYIQPGETCVMSFSAGLKNERSKVVAITKETTTTLLLPADKLSKWLYEYPILNQLFYQQYDLRYTEMINTIHHLLFDKLDKRLLDYLKEKVSISHTNPIKISHKEIAVDLGTAREVVSRLIKKLENHKKLKQHVDCIELF